MRIHNPRLYIIWNNSTFSNRPHHCNNDISWFNLIRSEQLISIRRNPSISNLKIIIKNILSPINFMTHLYKIFLF